MSEKFSCGMINPKQTNKTPRIIETDFSFAISLAMTHAACRAFSSCDLLTYLTRCWNTIQNANTMPARLTVLHNCAALLLKIFQRMVVQYTEKSKTRKIWLYVLARLQSSSLLKWQHIWLKTSQLCRSTSLNKRATKALDRLKAAVQMHENDVQCQDTKMCHTSH